MYRLHKNSEIIVRSYKKKQFQQVNCVKYQSLRKTVTLSPICTYYYSLFFYELQNFVRASLFLATLCDLTSYDSEDDSLSIIRQKGEYQNGCYKKTKHAKFPYQGVKKCSFFGKFGVLCFLETPVLRFVLLPYYRRLNLFEKYFSSKNISGYIMKYSMVNSKCVCISTEKEISFSAINDYRFTLNDKVIFLE